MIHIRDVIRPTIKLNRFKHVLKTCSYRVDNTAWSCIVCTNENMHGIKKSEYDCQNCLASTGKNLRKDFVKNMEGNNNG